MNIEKKVIELYKKGEIEEAINISYANLWNRKCPDIFRLLSIMLLEKKQYNEAINIINKGLTNDKNNKYISSLCSLVMIFLSKILKTK